MNLLRNHHDAIQTSETVGRLPRVVGIIEPALAVEQELVGISPGREAHRSCLPVSGFNGYGSDSRRTPIVPAAQNLDTRRGMVMQ